MLTNPLRRADAIVDAIERRKSSTAKEIAEDSGMKEKDVEAILEFLCNYGLAFHSDYHFRLSESFSRLDTF